MTQYRRRRCLALVLFLGACGGEQAIRGRTTSAWIERFYLADRRAHTEAHQVISNLIPTSRADVRALLRALRDSNPDLQQAVHNALGRGEPRAGVWMREALTDADPAMRAAARAALMRLDTGAPSDTTLRAQAKRRSP